ncbi:MAG: hypothetical protein F6K14_30865 [Symploca sp. SIO2C1]|nr:hypothetical protein [Symploca sp. SIO2C1]
MSQEQQQPPESAEAQNQMPLEALADESDAKKDTDSLGKPEPGFITTQTIKLLRGTIKLLEGVVVKLEAPPVSKSTPLVKPSRTRPKRNIADTTEPGFIPSTSDIPEPAEESVDDWVPQLQKTKLTDRLLPSFNSLQTFWDAVLGKVRSLFPASWNDKLSDWGLTGAIATITVVLLLTTVALLPQTSAQEEKTPRPTIEAPPELKAPEQPQLVPVEPPPPPVLTPEQSLISAIQNQVVEITEEYGEGLIKAIQANFLESRLIVKVSNSWYELETQQQDNLADQILAQAVELDFSKLEMNDLDGTLVARNPVVGTHMVILRR